MDDVTYTLNDARAYERARDYAKSADIYFAHGAYGDAERLYLSLERQFPFHKEIKFKFGRLLTILKQWDEAILKLQEVGHSGVFFEETLYLLAECFTQKGMRHAAREIYLELLEHNYHYKDARQRLQALDAPALADFATTQSTQIMTSGAVSSTLPAPQNPTIQGFTVDDRYILLAELGRGGMGVVYKADDRLAHREVAIKVLPPYLAAEESNRIRFFREAELVRRLRHPHIVTVFDVNEKENFLVMEYLAGGTFSRWKAEHQFSGEAMLPLLDQILEALETVHQQGIIHRDLKPDNILIADPNTAKLTDFGIAHICGATITHTGTHLGTLPYMAPEQILGSHVDARADVYAIGVILYELFTGSTPFTGHDTSYHQVHTPPRLPQEIIPPLSPMLPQIILTCLAKDPDKRYQTVTLVRAALHAVHPCH